MSCIKNFLGIRLDTRNKNITLNVHRNSVWKEISPHQLDDAHCTYIAVQYVGEHAVCFQEQVLHLYKAWLYKADCI